MKKRFEKNALRIPGCSTIDQQMLRFVNAGFWASRALSSAIELNVLGELGDGQLTPKELAKKLGVSDRGLEALLRFLQVLRLVTVDKHGSVKRTEYGARLFRELPKWTSALLVSERVWRSFEMLTDKIRHGPTGSSEEFFSTLNPDEEAGFFQTMLLQQEPVCEKIGKLVNLSQKRVLVDIGCGPARISLALLARFPRLRAILLDTPNMISMAEAMFDKDNNEMQGRIKLVAGDFWRCEIEEPFDALLVSRVLHDWDDGDAVRLLRKFVDPLPIGGSVFVHEEVIHNSEEPTPWPSLVDLFLFATLGSGRTRTVDAVADLLRRCGCELMHTLPIDFATTLLIAEKRADIGKPET